MFNDFRFGLGIFTTHLTYICLKRLFHMENHIKGVTTARCLLSYCDFYVERTFKAYVCQMCGKYAKTKS